MSLTYHGFSEYAQNSFVRMPNEEVHAGTVSLQRPPDASILTLPVIATSQFFLTASGTITVSVTQGSSDLIPLVM